MEWLYHNCSHPWTSKIQDSANKMTSRQLHTARPKALALLDVCASASPLPQSIFSRRNMPKREAIWVLHSELPSSLSSLSQIICLFLWFMEILQSKKHKERSPSFLRVPVTGTLSHSLAIESWEAYTMLFQSNGRNICRYPFIALRLTRSIYRTETLVYFPAHSGYQRTFVEFQVSSKLLINFFL